MRCQISLAFAKETFLTNYGQQQDRHVEEWHDGGREEKRNRYNRDFEGFERRNEPTNVIMLRGLNALTTQEKVRSATFQSSNIVFCLDLPLKLTDVLKAFGPIEDVRLIRNKATGESRCFAFVDFATVEEAAAFMEYYGGILELDERTVQMDFSRQKEHPTGEYKDWLCAQVEDRTNFLILIGTTLVFGKQLCSTRCLLSLPCTKTSKSCSRECHRRKS